MMSALPRRWRSVGFRLRRLYRCAGVGLLAALVAVPAAAASFPLRAREQRVVGHLGDYVTGNGDVLVDVARRFDLGYTQLIAANPGVDPWVPGAGRRLTLPNLYILPDAPHKGIVVNLAQWRLYYFPRGGERVETHPLGLGVIGWATPRGTTRVVGKKANPAWYPPASIRAVEPGLPSVVPAGPNNPLGAFALRLGWPGYLIHGTNKPDGVGRNVSHGCIRLYPKDIEKLFHEVRVGTPVRVVDQPATAGWIGLALYVQVYPSKSQADEIDTEREMTPAPVKGLKELVSAAAGPYVSFVDWAAVARAQRQRTGLPVKVAEMPPLGPEAAE